MQPESQKTDFQPSAEPVYVSPPSPEVVPQENQAPLQAAELPVVETTMEVTNTSTESDEPVPDEATAQDPVQWQAPEYLHHEKNPLWYIGFGIVVILLTVAAVFLIKSWTFAILIPVMAAALIAYSHRPPRIMDYVVSGKGIYINDTLHPFAEFKSFGVIHDEEEYSVVFIPVRRFRPSLTVYFPEDKGEAIVDFLGVRLPMQPLQLDAFDKIVRFLGL